MTVCLDRELALHAYFDGELDDGAAADLDAHLAACEACRAELERLDALSAVLRRVRATPDAAGEASPGAAPESAVLAPDTMRAAVRATLRRPQGRASLATKARGWLGESGGRAAAAAAVLVLATLGGYVVGSERGRTTAADAGAQELLSSHLRALLPGRLTDVTASDRHQVKPWFAGRLDFAPPVPDLAAAGFPLVGGRVDFYAAQRAAAVVYLRRRHVVDVYILPARPGFTVPAPRQAGYSVVAWREDDLQLVAISDVDPSDLRLFARLHAAAARAPASPPER